MRSKISICGLAASCWHARLSRSENPRWNQLLQWCMAHKALAGRPGCGRGQHPFQKCGYIGDWGNSENQQYRRYLNHFFPFAPLNVACPDIEPVLILRYRLCRLANCHLPQVHQRGYSRWIPYRWLFGYSLSRCKWEWWRYLYSTRKIFAKIIELPALRPFPAWCKPISSGFTAMPFWCWEQTERNVWVRSAVLLPIWIPSFIKLSGHTAELESRIIIPLLSN